ncbi:aminotransferase class III-fold pyridoxal phosphate-dependent enzyme [Methylobrevis albus]|uniref:Aminotransferase class III-fold pyridoxal phosphate-dependent enzyme n=1 Tax=Methylobrevis albus TaxID=2793297 RepID=A0A931MX03_9HYPH|nr:aminotransferase class III-fold pyridoxal phosphate-dependent enzyme [Methylobrevis albus]MBH0238253.1 aminotransferase class III-fold pyridoxal phosphate-dependent enzyme [Methylobrevis albus]
MRHLVGGISSAGRAVPALDGTPFIVARAAGPYLWDDRGRRYVDTALGFGATILGHAPATVVAAVAVAMADGASPAFAHDREEQAAAALAALTGPLSQVVFTSTGSEAVHLACRIARAVTGRTLIAKAAAGFDGWYDDVAFGNAGAPEAAMTDNTRPRRGRTTLLRYNDFTDVEALFAETPDIAAVIVEPMMANAGCIVADPGYLAHVAEVARRHGALVIADEVLMGFRIAPGLASHRLGFEPDLATVGKAIGSGVAVAAVVGRPEVMIAGEDGRASRGGTYAGNPVAAAAVIATLAELPLIDYPGLVARGDGLRAAIERSFAEAGTKVATAGYGTVFTVWFADAAPRSYAEAHARLRPERSAALHAALRRHGVMTMPSPYGRLYLSSAHDAGVISELAGAFAAAAAG